MNKGSNLGFVDGPTRNTTALTRGRELLIVIGGPLSTDTRAIERCETVVFDVNNRVEVRADLTSPVRYVQATMSRSNLQYDIDGIVPHEKPNDLVELV